MQTTPYTYVTLRYVHDIGTEEFVNVGVVLYAPEARFAKAGFRHTYTRLSQMFPGFNPDHFRRLMTGMDSRFSELARQTREDLDMGGRPGNALELSRSVLPHDDSSFQWSEMGGGVSADLDKTLESLFQRLVMRYDSKAESDSRSDDAVWRSFRHKFEEKRVLQRLGSKTITIQDDEVEFHHALKNGIWHCMEAVSFDLVQATNIKQKAHLWLGKMTSIQEANERFKMYYLIGEPKHAKNRIAFEQALAVLGKTPVEHEIILEDQSESFANRVAAMLEAHDQGGG